MIGLRFIPLPRRHAYLVFRHTTQLGTVYQTFAGWHGRQGELEIGPYESKRKAGYQLAVFAGVAQ